MDTKKKALEIFGHLLVPVSIGASALISEMDGLRRTSRVVSITPISDAGICFETLNTNYRLHITDKEERA